VSLAANILLGIRKRVRSTRWIYRPYVLFCRCLIPALKDGFWAGYRSLFALASFNLYYKFPDWLPPFGLWSGSIRNGPPFRFFSVYQVLRCGYPRLDGRIVLEDQKWPVVKEGTPMAHGSTQQHIEQPWPVLWSRHRNVSLVSSSLALVNDKKEMCLESVYGHRGSLNDPAGRYFRLPAPVVLDGNWTSLVSRWVPTNSNTIPNHSHWLLDALPRLALLNEFPSDARIIVPGKLAAYQWESLALLGIPKDRIRPSPEIHLQVENYYFSSPTAMIACYNPYAVRFLREKLLEKRDRSYRGPKRLYLRRSKARDLGNGAEVERFVEQLGWTIIDPSQLTFGQELQLFYEAEAVCGLGGSAFTNTLFSRPECVVVVMGHDYWVDGALDWIVQTVGIKNYNEHVYPSNGCRQSDVDIGTLERQLRSAGLL
jgi:Glycosyltransferase 61